MKQFCSKLLSVIAAGLVAGMASSIAGTLPAADSAEQMRTAGRANARVSVAGAPLRPDQSIDKTEHGVAAAESSRQSHYQDGGAVDVLSPQTIGKSVAVAHVDMRADKKILREKTPQMSSNISHFFTLYDAGVSLQQDSDYDGYYRSFSLRFDADVSVGSALVYAKVYTRRVGASDWEWFYTTSDFWLNGNSDLDDYYLDATLNSDYPTGTYDVLIDLYESSFTGIVATLDQAGDSSLRDLPLEEAGQDLNLGDTGISIGAISTELLTDDDHDGYYSRFRVSFDPDSNIGTQAVYAVLWVRAQNGVWLKEHTSANFTAYDSGGSDTYRIDGEWDSGYNSSRYDMEIELYDAATRLLVARVASERPELSRIPLEDRAHDQSSSGGGDVVVDEHGGGGSQSILSVLFAGLLVLAQALYRRSPRT